MTPPPGVFINCPFDSAFEECHNAIVLTVVACGLQPRSALESGTSSTPRMTRIRNALMGSKYSIHDLTRAYGDPVTALARFNMPFEFGMAFLFADVAVTLGEEHDWMGLLPDAHPHGEFISDLAGCDLFTHSGTAQTIIPPVLSWLLTRPGLTPPPPSVYPAAIIALTPEFELLLAAEQKKWGGHLPWSNLIDVARDLIASRLP